MSLSQTASSPSVNRDDKLQVALNEHGLELTPDGNYGRWATSNKDHPRNWPGRRKVYDIGLVIFLDLFTCVIPLHVGTAPPTRLQHIDQYCRCKKTSYGS